MIKRFISAAKTILGAAVLLIAVTTTAAAQETDKISESSKAVAAQMKNQLGLNDTQYTQVVEVNKAYLKKVKDCNESADNASAKAKKTHAINEERDTKLKSVLTATQYKKYAAARANNIRKLKDVAGL
ncbi:DUF4890 domain-containing protein [Flavobacterium sp. NRK1]|uniref:DUF4890 domain-containing protein n=1 Tax=Flavobacterium sp. NRK1 TaxID=2954929 RepID=UPI0020924F66|nr:DUF4890 domain-containing protein [Flavobacterium sp. NRK1]MCO6147349.1 DUF4890 domain-containing protein [Flavobacterium sp. NRK1]